MESNVLQKRWVQGRNVVVDDLRGTAFTGENGAHTFRVIGVDSAQETVAITGTITGRFLTATNVTVPLTGSVSDGVASLTLTEDCYVIPGRFVLSIYATNGSTTQCIYCAVGNVFRTQSDIIEYPSASIPDIEQIIADAQAAVTQINADVAAAQAAVAAAQTAVDGIEDQRQTMIASIASVAGQGTDTTLTQSGVAADAKAAGDQVSALKSAFIAESTQFEDYGTGLLSRGQFQRGLYNPTNNSYALQYTYRIGARVQIVFPYAVTLTIKSGFRFLPYRYENGAWVQKGWATGTYSIPANDPFYCQIARTTDDTSENANIEEFLKAVVVSGNAIQKQIDEIKTVVDTIKPFVRDLNTDEPEAVEVENGAWGVISGALDGNQSSTIRIRGKYVYKVSPGMKIIFRSDNVQCYVAELSDLSNGTITANSGWMDNRLSKIESVYTTTGNGYVYINYRFSDNSAITADDYTGYTYVVVSGFAYNIPEKAVHVYHFGGAGNDWCFVRTPANYNPKRDKPYPFVICNHGNGWTMDGTLITSNWTNITMYWSESETGWIAGRMIDTDDESLWGSNPTIEALLAAGYVVCGCENYADAQYGNTPCRNACVDFFYHMISRYNVEKRCYMIGASNGAMTSLNAAYILQGAVKAMVLQYPLTCLVDQYFSNTSQQAGIKTAYGIPTADVGSEDTEENRTKLTKYVATHDPLTVDVVDGKKIGSFPPVKLYYSPDDTVTRASVNALVMYDLLDASNKVVEKVQCSGAHGDQSHFAPSDYVAWFNAH